MNPTPDLLAGAVDRLTLRFRDRHLERRFSDAQALKSVRMVRLAMFVATGIGVLIWALHVFTPLSNRVLPGMNRVMFIGTLSTVLTVGATYSRFMVRHAQACMVVLGMLMAFGITAASFRALPAETLVARGFLMLLLHEFTIYTLLLRFPGAVLAGWLAEAVYIAAALSHGAFSEPGHFVPAVVWLTMGNIWGMALCYQIDQRSRREYLALEQLAAERERSERLLLNILPQGVAERPKKSGDAIADHAENVTVLFADIVGFTPLSARKSPHELVALLNRVFSEFDALADRHGLEKIKTIGDAYMAVAGLPDPCADHAPRAARMALDMLVCVRAIGRETGEPLDVRIGLNSGPVVAGVIGRRKFSYDMWGDTVNTASRMESHGEPGTVHCTAATARWLADSFALQPRGRVQVKGKGEMETYLLAAAA